MSDCKPLGKVLSVIGDTAEVGDTIYPDNRVPEDGYEIMVAAPEKPTYHLGMHDFHPEWDITVEYPGYLFANDIASRDVNPCAYVGLIISGGRAPEYLRYDQDLMRIVQHFNASHKPIGSVCHGIEVIAAADIIRGRRVTCVQKCRFDVEVCGGIWVDEPVVVDGNLVTAVLRRITRLGCASLCAFSMHMLPN